MAKKSVVPAYSGPVSPNFRGGSFTSLSSFRGKCRNGEVIGTYNTRAVKNFPEVGQIGGVGRHFSYLAADGSVRVARKGKPFRVVPR